MKLSGNIVITKRTMELLSRLIEEVERLSSPADEQVAYLYQFFSVDPRQICSDEIMELSADELALEFHDSFVLADQLFESGAISNEAWLGLVRLDNYLNSMSGNQNVHLWNSRALHVSPEWKTARRLAATALDHLHRSPELPAQSPSENRD